MKRIVKSLLLRAGWEIHRTDDAHRSSMTGGLRRLANRGTRFNTVLDVGASDGRWTEQCMEFFPDAKYLLFEPQPVHAPALDAFVGRHRESVVAIKKAVGASEGFTHFDASDPLGGALAEQEGAETIQVSLTTLDTAITETGARPPYLLKLDTHGFERSILGGASKTLEHCEALIIEAYNFRISGEAMMFWELCALVSAKGFRTVDVADVLRRPGDNALWHMDLFFIRSNWTGFELNSYR